MWKKKYGRACLATDDNVAHALSSWLTKAADTHAEYVILISFPRQQWLRERVSVLQLYVRFLPCLHFRLTLIPFPFVTFRRIVMPSSSGSSKVLTFRRIVVPSSSGQATFWRFGGSLCLHLRGQAKFWRFGWSWCLHLQGQAKFWRFGGPWCLHLRDQAKFDVS